MSSIGPTTQPMRRRVVFVVGSGRSGTSTMAGALQALGMHVPPPEVKPDETNPKGFAESQWVVDVHSRLLKRSNVAVSDARPTAWFEAGKVNTFGPLRVDYAVPVKKEDTDEEQNFNFGISTRF